MIAIIDTGVANLSSVQFALTRIGANCLVTDKPDRIHNASHVILPGVGTANAVMKSLEKKRLVAVIQNLIQPVLGICLGMQLLFDRSEEGDVTCLGVIPGDIKKMSQAKLIVPHMGWNQLVFERQHVLLRGIENKSYYYFVHSYFAPLSNYTLATTEYGQPFSAICQYDNFYATQFHPERSGEVGSILLRNFISL